MEESKNERKYYTDEKKEKLIIKQKMEETREQQYTEQEIDDIIADLSDTINYWMEIKNKFKDIPTMDVKQVISENE